MKKFLLFLFVSIECALGSSCFKQSYIKLANDSDIIAKGTVISSDYDSATSFKFWRWFRKKNKIEIKINEFLKGESKEKRLIISYDLKIASVIGYETDFKKGENLLLILKQKDGELILDPDFWVCNNNVFSISRSDMWPLMIIKELNK